MKPETTEEKSTTAKNAEKSTTSKTAEKSTTAKTAEKSTISKTAEKSTTDAEPQEPPKLRRRKKASAAELTDPLEILKSIK